MASVDVSAYNEVLKDIFQSLKSKSHNVRRQGAADLQRYACLIPVGIMYGSSNG